MTLQSIARRYAAALFDVVQKTGTLDRVERDLAMLTELIASHDGLRKVFATPAVPAQNKRAMVDALVAAAGDLAPETSRLLTLLADRDRLGLLTSIAAAFADRALAAKNIVRAQVVTAAPLGDQTRAALSHALGKAAGAEVIVTERVDPSIVGGVVAQVGGVVFDGSVTRQVERMREKLLAGA